MCQQSTTTEPRAWSVRSFEQFWSGPKKWDPAVVPAALSYDVVGRWAGRDEPVRGKEAYTRCIEALVEALPDLHLTVAEHARDGEFFFIRWIMHATGERGPFEISGIDRVRVRDGLVAENVVVVDTAAFQARSGKAVPWT